MSKSTTPSDEDGREQDLLDIAKMDLESAKYARDVLKEKYGYSEGELP